MWYVKLLSKKEAADRTTAFFFEKPRTLSATKKVRGKPKKFDFIPGQFIEITLNKETYPFSIASSPKEKELMITTRMRPSKFKKALGKLKIGVKVRIEGPFGQFVLHQKKKMPAVFLAGGIGITPFYSMIKTSPDRKIILFYSNRKKKDAPFLEELSADKNFKMIAVLTRESKKRINPKMIKNNIKEWRKAVYYAVGSTGFVQSMADMLSKMKIKPEQVKTENFPGY